jgi:hypothetical protein
VGHFRGARFHPFFDLAAPQNGYDYAHHEGHTAEEAHVAEKLVQAEAGRELRAALTRNSAWKTLLTMIWRSMKRSKLACKCIFDGRIQHIYEYALEAS